MTQERLESVSFEDGKYTLVKHPGGSLEWRRHGEPWPAANPPDKKDFAIFYRVQDLEAEVAQLRDRLQFDPGGSDKIDELEQAMEFLRHDVATRDAEIARLTDLAAHRLRTLDRKADEHAAEIADVQACADGYMGTVSSQKDVIASLRAEVERLTSERDFLQERGDVQMARAVEAEHALHPVVAELTALRAQIARLPAMVNCAWCGLPVDLDEAVCYDHAAEPGTPASGPAHKGCALPRRCSAPASKPAKPCGTCGDNGTVPCPGCVSSHRCGDACDGLAACPDCTGKNRQQILAEIDRLPAECNAHPLADVGLHLLRVPAGTRVLTLEGSTPADVKKHGLDQLRVTFAGPSRDAMGDLGRQLACIAAWGLPKPAKAAKGGGQSPLLEG